MSVSIERLYIPDAPEGPDAEDFLAALEVARKVRIATWGSDDLAYSALEKLAEMQDPYERQIMLIARLEGEIVGVVDMSLPMTGDLDVAEFTLDILPQAQHHGVGRRLIEAAEQLARLEGRRHLMAGTSHPAATLDTDQGHLTPDSGTGFVPLASRSVEFARRGGYSLERIEQFSSCLLPLDSRLEAEVQAECDAATKGRYRLHVWSDTCPQNWLADVVNLETADEDNFAGEGLDIDFELPDEAGWRAAEELAVQQGRRTVVAAVEDIASGTLVGITTISVLPHRQDVVFQDETRVLNAHRGNKLGLLLKLANMQRLEEMYPDARVIYTWNALENRYLLIANQQLGYRTAGVTGLWQKQLPDLSVPNLT